MQPAYSDTVLPHHNTVCCTAVHNITQTSAVSQPSQQPIANSDQIHGNLALYAKISCQHAYFSQIQQKISCCHQCHATFLLQSFILHQNIVPLQHVLQMKVPEVLQYSILQFAYKQSRSVHPNHCVIPEDCIC